MKLWLLSFNALACALEAWTTMAVYYFSRFLSLSFFFFCYLTSKDFLRTDFCLRMWKRVTRTMLHKCNSHILNTDCDISENSRWDRGSLEPKVWNIQYNNNQTDINSMGVRHSLEVHVSETSSLAEEWIVSPLGNRGAFRMFMWSFLNLSGS